MSWISDVKYELSELDISKKSLKKFGLLIGSILILIGVTLSNKTPMNATIIIFILCGIFLFISGLIKSSILESTYKIWMGFAFALGWVISRVILMILFYLVITPIGSLSKLFHKSFLDIQYRTTKTSSWIKKNSSNSNIDKMY